MGPVGPSVENPGENTGGRLWEVVAYENWATDLFPHVEAIRIYMYEFTILKRIYCMQFQIYYISDMCTFMLLLKVHYSLWVA